MPPGEAEEAPGGHPSPKGAISPHPPSRSPLRASVRPSAPIIPADMPRPAMHVAPTPQWPRHLPPHLRKARSAFECMAYAKNL
jgi:hypothetical protein